MPGKKVMAFGTFDMLHKGHEYFLRESRKRGDEIVVVVARDATVKKVKGRLPSEGENERLEKVKTLGYVSKAVLGSRGSDKLEVVRRERPDVICVGYDQEHFIGPLKDEFPEMPIIRIGPFWPQKYKTSIIKAGKRRKLPANHIININHER